MRRRSLATLATAALATLAALAAFAPPTALVAAQSASNLIKGPDGRPLFMYGVNIGNVKFLPFSRATQYSQSPGELRGILDNALREISETGEGEAGKRGERGVGREREAGAGAGSGHVRA